MANIISNFSRPAPAWFRTGNAIYGNLETLVIAILLINGVNPDGKGMLEFKLISSFLRTNLGLVLTNGQEYAPAGATVALQNATNKAPEQAILENNPTKEEPKDISK